MKISRIALAASLTTLTLTAQTPAPKPVAPPAKAPAPAEAKPVDPNQVVLAFGDRKYTPAQIDELIAQLPDDMKQSVAQMGKPMFIQQYAEYLVLLDEARTRNLAAKPEVKKVLDFGQENTLVGFMIRELAKEAEPKDEELTAYYEGKKADYVRVAARHILIRTSDSEAPKKEGKPELTEEQALAKAEALRKKLTDGASFEELAKAESDDSGSAERGGDLGEFAKGMMVPQFEEAAFALPPGIVSPPVRSPYGYHLIRVDKRDFQPLDAVKQQIKQRLQGERLRTIREKLKTDKGFKLDPAYMASLQTAPGAAPAPATVQQGGQVTVPVQVAPAPKPKP